MTLKAFFTMLRAHIWLLAVGIAVAAGAGSAAFMLTPLTYQFTARFLLLSPARSVAGETVNPFLNMGNAITSLADVSASSLSDDATVLDMRALYPGLEYTLVRDTATSASVIVLTLEDRTESEARIALDDLSARVANRVDAIQRTAKAPADLMVTTTVLTRDTRPTTLYTASIRSGIATAAGVLGLDLLLISWLQRRRGRAANSSKLDRNDSSRAEKVAPARLAGGRRVRRRSETQAAQPDGLHESSNGVTETMTTGARR